MPAIARVHDPHTCPVNFPQPHVGGTITGPGGSVTIGYQAVALEGAPCTCGAPGAFVAPGAGSPGLTIDYRPAARVGSQTTHGGTIVAGYDPVEIP